MNQRYSPVFVGNTLIKGAEHSVSGEYVTLLGDTYFKINNYDIMAPTFMSLVSSSDHWLFISSTGGLTAGRVNIEQALFPYYTEDKLTENSENSGGKTILLVKRSGQIWLWEPFSIRQQGVYDTQRNLYKNIPGTALIFEEINNSLSLTYRYAWRTSDRFGFVKTSWLHNGGSMCDVDLLDGIQNILPANTPADIQNRLSCLLDAYKRNELDLKSGLAIYTLNSTLTDQAEPSESLLATTVFQVGLETADYLLSSVQLDHFRAGKSLTPETETRGSRGAFFVYTRLALAQKVESTWHIVADVNQDSAAVVKTINALKDNRANLSKEIEIDIASNTTNLKKIVSSADGMQISADLLCTAHHFSNVMFNVMRGGIFANQYWIDKIDFVDFVSTHNHEFVEDFSAFFANLPDTIHVSELHTLADATNSADLIRLSYTYLPLTFSRRHGDPSRPWNRFAINIKNANGTLRLDYEGNWRDIFQNWEALAFSYPEFIEGMIFTFLCATTVDGYNPYRINRAGIDWEIPEPGNPWANIGYWSDHQIVYLLKLIEFSLRVHPGKIRASLERSILSYANVPYRIKPYTDLLKDPYNTIDFDYDLEAEIESKVKRSGTDGKLVYDSQGQVLHRSMAEKLLTLLLAKLVNFVPEGGIWMNTQRPEWNDANNALVGKGLSVVTLGYLNRYIAVCQDLFKDSTPANLQISNQVAGLFSKVVTILEQFHPLLDDSYSEQQRRTMMDALGQAGSEYRQEVYANDLSGGMTSLSGADVLAFLELARDHVRHSLRANRRNDNLYHSYNILNLGKNSALIGRLYEMLEGQVSILSSGLLSADESQALLKTLRHSALYSADQHSYLLYPDKTIPSFLQKNSLTQEQMAGLKLHDLLVENRDQSLLAQDENGNYHFNGAFRNVKDVQKSLETLSNQPKYEHLVAQEREKIIALFEETFRHSEFTGRSGTFFAYEGLGSVYWHMVSKLLLAVQETVLRFQHESVVPALLEKYKDIRAGLGFNKTPAEYGAFPTDPYSHTPKGQGARQPGMTGTVKEEILTRFAEMGLIIEDGCLTFNPLLLDRTELLTERSYFTYVDVTGRFPELELAPGSMACSFCQTPVILQIGEQAEIRVAYSDGHAKTISGHRLDASASRNLFLRDGTIRQLTIIFS